MDNIIFLNPTTCGIYKDGGPRYKVDPATGNRTRELDNEMADQVTAFLEGRHVPGLVEVPETDAFKRGVLVPRYYDDRWLLPFRRLLEQRNWQPVSLGDLEERGVLRIHGGHGSPSNDKRTGHIPYVKVSDIRGLRVNINPTNLVSDVIARQYWKGRPTSGLEPWDLVTPNRASSNIGEFAILLPGEEQVVLTKEVFVVRVLDGREEGWSPFYLLWALCLRAVRVQWQRVALMQTNREDVGKRYREILVPKPQTKDWADSISAPFRHYFTTLADARTRFRSELHSSGLEYIASAFSSIPSGPVEEEVSAEPQLPADVKEPAPV